MKNGIKYYHSYCIEKIVKPITKESETAPDVGPIPSCLDGIERIETASLRKTPQKEKPAKFLEDKENEKEEKEKEPKTPKKTPKKPKSPAKSSKSVRKGNACLLHNTLKDNIFYAEFLLKHV